MAALFSLTLASPWAAAAGANVAQVTVVSPGGAEQTLVLSALAGSEDTLARPYGLRSSTGESSTTVTGFSLAAILDAAGADPYGFSYLEVERPAGGTVQLSREQALGDGHFLDGPPAVYTTADGTGFLRPSAGPEDFNDADSFVSPQGISLVLRKGSPLHVRALASKAFVRPGQPVRFSAVVDRAGSGEQLTYSWYFDDGHSATNPETSHSFVRRGSYDVVLGVTSAGNDTGASDVVTIQVGAPNAGPDRKGGGRSDDASAPDHGAADGPTAENTATASPGAPEPADRRVGCAPTDTQHGRRPCVRRGMTGSPSPTPNEHQPAPGNVVTGELISATTSAPPTAAKQAAARSGHLNGDGSGVAIPGAVWALLATLGLLGAGALIETRGRGAFVTHRVTKAPRGGQP